MRGTSSDAPATTLRDLALTLVGPGSDWQVMRQPWSASPKADRIQGRRRVGVRQGVQRRRPVPLLAGLNA